MDICVWDKCNNRCLMCTNPDHPWPNWDGSFDYSFSALKERMHKIKDKIQSDDSIYLSGGEPTLHPNFIDILQFLKIEFPKHRIKLLTNGRMFSYEKFAQKAMSINDNFEIDLSLYGPDAKTHDAVTRSSGSFEQTLKGLENIIKLKSPEQVVGNRFVITKMSYQYIQDYLELMRDRFINVDRVILIFWEIEHQALKNFDEVKIDYNSVRAELDKVTSLLYVFRELRLYHFPLCTIPTKQWKYMWRTLDEKDVKFISACKECNYKKYCLGVPITYLENMEESEFAPIKDKIKIDPSGDKYKPIKNILNV